MKTAPAPPVSKPVKGAVRPPGLTPRAAQSWYTPSALWQRKRTVIAALSIVGILWHLVLRFGIHSPPTVVRIRLLATLVIGGLPLLYDLFRKLLKREFGSDLLGGISVVTSVLLGEYLAGSIIVLMLSECLTGSRLKPALIGVPSFAIAPGGSYLPLVSSWN